MRLEFHLFGVDVTLVDSDPEYDFTECSDDDLQRIIESDNEEEDPSLLKRQAWHEQMVRDVRR